MESENSGMADISEPLPRSRPIFEAVVTPHRSMTTRGMYAVFALMAAGSLLITSLMYFIGALPVIGFDFGDLILAVTLLGMNMRAARASEVIILTEDRLTITRTNPRGQRREISMTCNWLRADLDEKAGSNPVLSIANRESRHIVGLALGEAERRDLASALRAAFDRQRSPRFDNPQTRV